MNSLQDFSGLQEAEAAAGISALVSLLHEESVRLQEVNIPDCNAATLHALRLRLHQADVLVHHLIKGEVGFMLSISELTT